MNLLLQFLTLLLTRAPEITDTARSVFREVGGTDAELDAALAENQKSIDRLKDPDSFRKRKDAPPKTFGPGGQYLVKLTTYPDRNAYRSGDEVWQFGEDAEWIVTQKGVGVGRPAAPWHSVETF